MEEEQPKPKSWEEAFENHNISVTRNIEKQLRIDISHNKEKLRTLVGGSHRQLLATAEQIVSLESQTANTEQHISELSRSCRPPQYDRSVTSRPKDSLVAQYSLLQKIASCISIGLKGGRSLQAAKLLAVSRVLHKSLSTRTPDVALLDALRQRIGSLRRQLLRKIDRKFRECQSTSTSLTQTVCAFCLATSSSVSDAVDYFHRLRLETIRQRIAVARTKHRGVHQVLHYFVDSLKVTKSFLSHEVLVALRRLQTQPILHDAEIQGIESLDLETLSRLLPTEVANFTPYIKNADQNNDEFKKLTQQWSAEAFSIFLGGLNSILANVSDGGNLFELRRELLLLWLSESFSIIAHPRILETLREAFNDHAMALIKARTAKAGTLGQDVQSVIATTSDDTLDGHTSLWAEDFVTMPLEKGATPFLRKLRTNQLGTTKTVQTVLDSLRAWTMEIQGFRNDILDLRTIRWQDAIIEADEDDEEPLKAFVQELAHSDPDLYVRELDSRLREAVTLLEDKLCQISKEVQTSKQCRSVVMLLRIVRDISSHLLASFPDIKLKDLFDTVPSLHGAVAEEVAQKLFKTTQVMRKSTSFATSSTLDNLPSPAAFRLLYRLCLLMREIGGADIWTPAAVAATKQAVWRTVLDSENQGKHLRNKFDEIYVGHALNAPTNIKGIVEDDAMNTGAAEYWSRTKVLFGLLA